MLKVLQFAGISASGDWDGPQAPAKSKLVAVRGRLTSASPVDPYLSLVLGGVAVLATVGSIQWAGTADHNWFIGGGQTGLVQLTGFVATLPSLYDPAIRVRLTAAGAAPGDTWDEIVLTYRTW